jgi:hypothetical protein
MRSTACLLSLVVGSVAGCGGDDCKLDPSYDPAIDPARFVGAVTNPLFPLVPGTKLVYEGGGEHIEVTVTSERRAILGVSTVVVRDTATVNGAVTEDTYDWYAQDRDGNVWYMGEDTKEYENGKVVSTEGSWEGGVDGAKPGILIPAVPVVGQPYRQEYAACEAEDMGEVLAVDQTVTVPAGTYSGCLQTKDTTPLEPDVQENKYYCPGVGLVLSVDVGSSGREELVQKTP